MVRYCHTALLIACFCRRSWPSQQISCTVLEEKRGWGITPQVSSQACRPEDKVENFITRVSSRRFLSFLERYVIWLHRQLFLFWDATTLSYKFSSCSALIAYNLNTSTDFCFSPKSNLDCTSRNCTDNWCWYEIWYASPSWLADAVLFNWFCDVLYSQPMRCNYNLCWSVFPLDSQFPICRILPSTRAGNMQSSSGFLAKGTYYYIPTQLHCQESLRYSSQMDGPLYLHCRISQVIEPSCSWKADIATWQIWLADIFFGHT